MRRLLALLVALVLALPVMPGMAESALQAVPPACVTPDDSCKESVAVGSARQYTFWYYRSYSLSSPNPNITRAVVVMHGMERNASDYFGWAVTGLANANDPSLLVIAPHFKGNVRGSTTCQDPLVDATELHWSCTGSGSVNRWDDGGEARNIAESIFSFDMIDVVVSRLNDPSLFPNLSKIYISGHSAGGQFTQRYAAGNQVDAGLPWPTVRAAPALAPTTHAVATRKPATATRAASARHLRPGLRPFGASQPRQVAAIPSASTASTLSAVPIKYVIANPGSYMYIDSQRLEKDATCAQDGTCTGVFTPNWDPTNGCPDSYNAYKYGLDSRTYGYMNSTTPGMSDPEVASRFVSRTIAYMVGEQDQTSASMFDTSCPANAQGAHLAGDGSGLIGGRRERGTIFWNYMQALGATAQTLTVVPTCSHDGQCMFLSNAMIQALST